MAPAGVFVTLGRAGLAANVTRTESVWFGAGGV